MFEIRINNLRLELDWYNINMKTCSKGLHQFNGRRCGECRKVYKKAWKESNSIHVKAGDRAWYRANPGKANAKRRRYEASKLQRTPAWLTKEQLIEIEDFYILAQELAWLNQDGKAFHVDHIIPLQGEQVSGLHVPWNLQLLSAEENSSKGNKF